MEEPYVHKIIDNKQTIGKSIFLTKTGFLTEHDREQVTKSQLDKAVFAYPIKHYTEEDGVSIERIGTNSEHFAVLEMDEFTVFIGDTYQIGEAIIQVSQPGPVSAEQLRTGLRTGWYFRVIQEGRIQEGTDLRLLERPYPQWSIAACSEIMYLSRDDFRAADDLYSCEALGDTWRRALRKRLRGY